MVVAMAMAMAMVISMAMAMVMSMAMVVVAMEEATSFFKILPLSLWSNRNRPNIGITNVCPAMQTPR